MKHVHMKGHQGFRLNLIHQNGYKLERKNKTMKRYKTVNKWIKNPNIKRKTNVEIVTEIMEYSRFGALSQAFVVNAIAEEAKISYVIHQNIVFLFFRLLQYQHSL